ncbi:MAG: TonB-linked SusC/RagA family outer membrane protein [Sediminicola sp.]|jgi:TonB-linked SusC/RagA family outer membrane protein
MKYSFLLTAFLLLTTITVAQNFNVKGTLIEGDSAFPLLGASIVLKGTTNGVVSDFDGNFSIDEIPMNGVLVISYLGFITRQVTITSSEFLTIRLETDSESLDEVIVVGYGTRSKKEITGAVSVISSETIEELAPTRIEEALQGQVAGVNITATSGAPGSASNIRIRGIATNGNNQPLILVDGNVVEDLSVINPSDIESISVLKDATAGIYGVRAANGVILITTKIGRKGSELKFDYNVSGGFQETTRKLPVLNATQYGLLVNESFANNGESLPFANVGTLGEGTNWQDEVFTNALKISNDFSMRGGTENSTYSFSASLLTQDGIVGGNKNNFTRYNSRVSFNTELFDKIKLKSGLTYVGTSNKGLAQSSFGSVLFNALNNAPTLSVKDVNGDFTLSEGTGAEVINPVAQIADTFNSSKVNKISGFFGLNYEVIKNVTVEANIQFNFSEVKGRSFNPIVFYGAGKVFNKDRSEYVENYNTFNDYTFDAFITYDNTWADKHHLNASVFTSVFRTEGEFSGSIGFDLEGFNFGNASLDNASDIQNFFPNGNAVFDSRLLSYFGRVQYDYSGKYLFSAVVRRDGSTKFGPENRFGVFPSASVGWIISDEQFLEDSSVVNFLKLRGSYGIVGSDAIPDFRFVSILNGEGEYVFNDELSIGIAQGAIANPEIRWEQQETANIGIDARFLSSKLNVSLDVFEKRTNDLLLVPGVSYILGNTAPGSSAPIVNAGDVSNRGLEFQIGYNEDLTDEMSFGVSYNFTTLKNEVLRVDNGEGFLSGGLFGIGQGDVARMEVGKPIGYFFGLQTDGIFQTQAEVDAHPSQIALGANAQPGDIRFVDTNGDGKIDLEDKTDIGNPIPDVTMGINLSYNYKNIDFQMYVFSSIGNQIVRNYERNLPLTNRTVYSLDRWTGAGSNNIDPRVTTGATGNGTFSDYFVEDGSFIRAQNMQVGYTFSDEMITDAGLDKLRIYFSASNVFTLTKYRGYDPTTSTSSPIGAGFDNGFYPSPRTYLLGVNLKF